MGQAPAGATEWSSRYFRSPGRGSDSIFTTNRWFAPPANIQCPFGTSRSLSSTNSRYAMHSRRFEVEDSSLNRFVGGIEIAPVRVNHSPARLTETRLQQLLAP